METQRDLLKLRREKHRQDLLQEMQRLTSAAVELGAQKVVLFGSVAQGKIGLASDLDLLITPTDCLIAFRRGYIRAP